MAGETKSLQFSDGVAVTQPTATGHEVTIITLNEQASTPATPASGKKLLYAKSDGRDYTLDDQGNEIEVGSDIEILTLAEQADTPDTPSAGFKKLYAKDNGKVYTVNSDGTEQEVGSGAGGSGSKNYISNPSAASDTSGWSIAVGGTLTRTDTAANLPREYTTPTGFAFTPEAQYDVIYYNFALDDTDMTAANLLAKISTKIDSADAGDWRLEIYSFSDSGYSADGKQIPLVGSNEDGMYVLPAGTHDTTSYWTPTGNRYIQFRIYYYGTGTPTLYFSDVLAGPGVASAVTPVGPIQTFTPVVSSGGITVTNNVSTWHQIGQEMVCDFDVTVLSVAGASGSNLGFTIPDSKTADSEYINTAASSSKSRDSGSWYDSSNSNNHALGTALLSSTSIGLNKLDTETDRILNGVDVAVGDRLCFTIRIPIAEWAGAVTYAGNNDAEYVSNSDASNADDTTSFYNGPAGSAFPSSALTAQRQKRIRFATPKQATDSMIFEVSPSGNVDDFRPVAGDWVAAGASTVSTFSSTAGAGFIERVSATEFDVYFSQYRSGTSDWNANTGIAKWRVVKHKSGVPVGFGQATATQPGLAPKQTPQTNLTVTGTNWTTTRAVGIAYSDTAGNWRLKFNITGSLSSLQSTAFTGTVSGVTFLTVTNGQSISASILGSGSAGRNDTLKYCLVNSGASTFTIDVTGAGSFDKVIVSGDVELASKPTWA